jgi:rod shape determining protein RodA
MRWIIPGVLVVLSLIGIITLRSVTPALVPLQATFAVIGVATFLFSWKIGFDTWSTFRWPMYAGLVVLLIATLLFAGITRGTSQWLTIAGINVQGSQLAVPIVGLVLAHYTSRVGLGTLKQIAIFGVMALVPALLIALAPDLGTTLILLFSVFGIAFTSNLKTYWLVGGFFSVLIFSVVAWNFFLAPYQQARISSFVQPSADMQGSGYNARQALIAVGSGQLFGRGLGQGVQSHLRFLPERQTDFIFASLAEEWGFIGATLVILLYVTLVSAYIIKAWQLLPSAEYYFLMATSFFFMFQVLVNIGMNMQLMPITGITLPFVSYGGSSFIAFCFHCGVAQSIFDVHAKKKMHHFG